MSGSTHTKTLSAESRAPSTELLSPPVIKRWQQIVACLCLAVLLPAASLAQQNEELDLRKKELQQLALSVEKIKKKIIKKQGKKTSTQKKFRQGELKIGELVAAGYQLTQQQQQLDQQLLQLSGELESLEQQRDTQRAVIGEHLSKAYRAGDQSALSLFFSESSPAELDRQLQYLERMNRARTQLIKGYATIIARKETVSEKIENKQQQLHNNQTLLAKQHSKLTKMQTSRQQLLQKLQSEIGSADEQRLALEQDHSALQTLIGEMNRLWQESMIAASSSQARTDEADLTSKSIMIYEQPSQFGSAKGQLPWPVKGTRQHRFGKTRSDADSAAQGVTIAAPSGSIVQAIYPGRVIFADWFAGQGLLTIVDHGEGYWSLYGRNQSLLKPVGARVNAGEAIATVGNSGGQSMPALYFEIRQHGKPNDPALWCRKG